MSQRWTRALLRLYPSRIRRRYGDELLDLQDELRGEGELSRRRLIRDALAGAVLVRSACQRMRILAGAVLVAGVIAAAVAVLAHGPRVSASPHALRAPTATVPPLHARPCLVSSGMSCSLRACTVFTGQMHRPPVEAHVAQAGDQPPTRHAKVACVDASRTLQPKPLFVSGATRGPASGLRGDVGRASGA